MFYPCLFCPSDNVWCSRRAHVPWCAHFYTVITPSWITQQISIENCAHQGMSARRERQTMLKSVLWTKQTWTTQHNTVKTTYTQDCFSVYVAPGFIDLQINGAFGLDFTCDVTDAASAQRCLQTVGQGRRTMCFKLNHSRCLFSVRFLPSVKETVA